MRWCRTAAALLALLLLGSVPSLAQTPVTIIGPVTVGNCVKFFSPVQVQDAGTVCGGAAGSVSSVGNAASDTSLTIAGTGTGPWTGNVTAKLNLGNPNTWTAPQTFNANNLILGGVTGSTQCLQAGATGIVTGTGSACGAGGGAVSSVSNADGTLTISPTTGAVVASIALGHVNTWTAAQTFSNGVTVSSVFTATGLVTLADHATQAANTVIGNATAGVASPTALPMLSCSTAASALNWTTNTGFTCNTSITAAAVPASGLTGTTLAANVVTSSLTTVGTLIGGATGAGFTINFTASTESGVLGLTNGGTNAALTASNGGVVYSTGSALAILAGTVTAGQCLLSGSSAAPSWASCPGAVSSVTNSDSTLTISPTTGAVVASLNLAHSNTWTVAQTFAGVTVSSLTDTGLASGGTQCVQASTAGLLSGTGAACGSGSGAVNSVTNADGTLTISPTTGAVVASLALGHANTWTAAQTFTNSDILLLGSSTGATTFTSANAGASNFTITFPAATGTVALAANANVASVSNADGTLTISPTTGAVVASLALGHANTWTAAQTFAASGIKLTGSSTGVTTFTSANAGASNFTLTLPAVTDTVAVLGTSQTHSATQTFSGTLNVSGTFQIGGTTVALPISLANGGTNNALTASAGGIVWSDASKLNILAGTSTAGQCLLSGNLATPSWSACPQAVTSVTNADGTLTISPTTGAVVASLALGHANTWTAKQTISGAGFALSGNITAAAWTTSGVRYANVAGTLTDSSSSGTVATAYTSVFGGDTIAASSVTTFTNYYSLYATSPVAGTNVTLTNAWALGADTLKVNGVATITGNLTTNVTGSTQCLQVNTSGVVSGFGGACGTLTGTLGPSQGGTGLSSPTAHSLLQTEGASNFALITAATAGRIVVDQGSGVDWSAVAVSGDCTLASSGAITCTKTSGTAFGTFATANAATPPAIGGTTPAAGSFTTLSATGNLTTNVTGGGTQCLQVNNTGVISGAGSGCNAVASVSNADGTLTISPTTGAVVASIALGHANSWTGVQTFAASGIKLTGSSTGVTTFTSANAGASNFTLTFPAVTDTVAVLGTNQTFTATQTFSGTLNASGTFQIGGTAVALPISLANGGTAAALTASNGGVVYSTGSALAILAGTATASQCLLSGSNAAPSWGSCSGGAAVSSVTNADGTLTISPTTGAVVASIALAHANTWTALPTVNIAGIAATSTDGLVIENTTAAGVGAQQWSPRLHFIGQGWKTNATAASQTVDWIAEVQPVQGAASPSSNLVTSFQINAGGYTALLSAKSGTSAVAAPSVNVLSASFILSGNISAPAWTTSGIQFSDIPSTLTDSTSSGTVAAAYTSVQGGNTIAASSATTYTNYYGSYFKNEVAGTNVTLTNKWALGGDSAQINGTLNVTGGGLQVGGSAWVPQPQGRLTLLTGTPVMRTNQTAKSQVFYDCYKGGNLVPVYNGTYDVVLPIAGCEISMTMATSSTGVTNTGGVFDVWGVNVAGALAICVATNGSGGGWASDTTGSNTARGTGYSQLDTTTRPYITNKNAITNCYTGATQRGSISANQATYLGTLATTAAGQTGMALTSSAAGGGAGVLGLFNAYNQVVIGAQEQDSTTQWTYATAAWRAADGNTNNSIKFVDGLGASSVLADYQCNVQPSSGGSNFGAIGVAFNWVSGNPAINAQSFTNSSSSISFAMHVATTFVPAFGLNSVNAVEFSVVTNTTTFTASGSTAGGQQQQLTISLLM